MNEDVIACSCESNSSASSRFLAEKMDEAARKARSKKNKEMVLVS